MNRLLLGYRVVFSYARRITDWLRAVCIFGREIASTFAAWLVLALLELGGGSLSLPYSPSTTDSNGGGERST